MNIDIKLHKHDLPDEIDLSKSDKIAIDCEFMGCLLYTSDAADE